MPHLPQPGPPGKHWLTVKTVWALLAAAAWGGAASALVTWWYSPENALSHQSFDPGHFHVQGIVPVGYALFAVASSWSSPPPSSP